MCLATASVSSYLLSDGHLKGIIITGALLGYIVFFALAPGALVWTLISELLPAKIRSMGLAVTLFISSMSGATLSSVFLSLEKHIGFGGIFALCATSTLIYIGVAVLSRRLVARC